MINTKTKKSKRTTYTDISCPQCGSNFLHKYGKDPKSNLQRYKCLKCNKQFVPNNTQSKKHYKHGLCPLCNSRLDLRKTNKNSLQLRCSKRPYCKFTISYNLKLKKFFFQSILDHNFFKLPKFFKFPIEMVLLALRLYFKHKLPLREIKNELKYRFPNLKIPSHVSIAKWTNKCSYLLSIALSNSTFKPSNNWLIWATDETVIKINGIKYYLIVVMDYSTGSILSWFLSATKDAQSVAFTLNLAFKLTNSIPNTIISDFAQNIHNAISLTFNNSVKHFQTSIYSSSNLSNNKLERFFSKIKSKLNNRRNFRSFFSAYSFFATFFILHNLNVSVNQNAQHLNNLLLKLPKFSLIRSMLLCIAL